MTRRDELTKEVREALADVALLVLVFVCAAVCMGYAFL